MRVKWDRSKGSPEPMAALDRVAEIESGEPLARLAEAAPSVLIARESVIPYLRKTVAERLENAARSLPGGLKIGVTDAWRPFARQKRIYDFIFRCAQEAFPQRSHAALKRTVNALVHAYDRKAPPGHCTGAAVDVWLFDAQGEPIDVSAPFSRYQAHWTYSLGLEPSAAEMRMTLVEAMLNAGFSNCREEWWHYSYGDAAWAVRTGQSSCVYGKIDLDPELYEEQERLAEEMFKDRPNPFLHPEDN